MATSQQTKIRNQFSQARMPQNGLMKLESRVLFSAASPIASLPEAATTNDGTAAVEVTFLPGDTYQPSKDAKETNAGSLRIKFPVSKTKTSSLSGQWPGRQEIDQRTKLIAEEHDIGDAGLALGLFDKVGEDLNNEEFEQATDVQTIRKMAGEDLKNAVSELLGGLGNSKSGSFLDQLKGSGSGGGGSTGNILSDFEYAGLSGRAGRNGQMSQESGGNSNTNQNDDDSWENWYYHNVINSDNAINTAKEAVKNFFFAAFGAGTGPVPSVSLTATTTNNDAGEVAGGVALVKRQESQAAEKIATGTGYNKTVECNKLFYAASREQCLLIDQDVPRPDDFYWSHSDSTFYTPEDTRHIDTLLNQHGRRPTHESNGSIDFSTTSAGRRSALITPLADSEQSTNSGFTSTEVRGIEARIMAPITPINNF